MTSQERERLGLGLVASLIVHVIAVLIVQYADWRVEPLPEFSGPMYVTVSQVETLPEVEPEEREELEEEPEEEPEQPEPEEPTPEPSDGIAAAEPGARPGPREEQAREPAPQREPAPETAQEQEPSSAREPPAERQPAAPQGPAEPAEPAEPQEERRVYEYSLEDIYERESEPGSERAPPESEEFDRLPPEGEPTRPDVEVPEWVRRPRRTVEEAGISTEEVAQDEVQELAEKVATDPEFERTLRDVVSALDARPSSPAERGSESSSTADAADEPDGESAQTRGEDSEGPGDSRFEWVGTGDRELTNPPAVPEGFFSADDFGGTVPARATFVVVFDVDWRGNVLPGSVIFQQGSGYVVAKEKLRGRIRGWTFEPAEGADVATGIFTLAVRREDIR